MGHAGGRTGRDRTVRILCVDDDEVNVRLVERLYRDRPGYEVTAATCGEDAVRLAASVLPGVILLDAELPDIDGLEVMRRLAGSASPSGIPVLIVTGGLDAEVQDGLRDAGAAGVLRKPWSPAELTAAVEAALL